MNNQLQIFKNENFGVIKTIVKDGDPLFLANPLSEILGYSKTNGMVRRLDDDEKIEFSSKEVGDILGCTLNELGVSKFAPSIMFITESGLYNAILGSDKKEAKQFKRWVTSEVLPQIRKTGSYINNQGKSKSKVDNSLKEKEIEARLKNARAREANILLKICNNPNLSKEYVQVLQSKATEIITGQAILPLPVAERKTYSATEIGKELGISANKVGILTNKHNLKTDEYGKLFHDKSPYSSKEVETFRYYDNVIPILKELLN